MRTHTYSKYCGLFAITTIALGVLVACGGGGGGGGGTSSPSSSTLQGTAAYGAPMSGATIVVMDSSGKSVTATADSNGNYTANVTGFVAPLMISATSTSGEASKHYVALLETVPALGNSATANVTPLTHALATLASSDGLSPEEFENDRTKLQNLDTTKFHRALGNLQGVLAPVLTNAGLSTNFDPIKTPFSADRSSAADVLLDTIKVTTTGSGVEFNNIRVAVNNSDNGSTATVTLTGATLTPPSTLPAPTVSASEFHGLDDFVTQANTCFALAPANRVSVDGSGNYTLLGSCAAMTVFSNTYKRSSYNLAQVWGPRLAFVPQGATVLPPEVLDFEKNAVNDDVALVRLAYKATGGNGSYIETARKIAGVWKLDGNQRNYAATVSIGLNRSVDVSTNGYVVHTSSNPGYDDNNVNVGRFSAYESVIYFSFDQSAASSADVYAVRVKGPGLPANGVVLARSTACGSDRHLSFYSNDGSLPAASVTAMPSATSFNGWRFDVSPLGTGYTGHHFYDQYRGITNTGAASSSTSNSIASTAVDVSTIPSFAKYDWEVFKVASGTAVADTFSTRIVTRPVPAAFGGKMLWAELTADAKEYANPAIAAKAASLTQGTNSWTLPAGAPVVTSAYISGSTTTARMAMDASVTPFGATSLVVSAATQKDGIGGVCAQSTLPSFTATTNTRSVGTRQLTDRGVELQQFVVHSGR